MTFPRTLLQLAGADLTPATPAEAALVLIDYQNEYLDGPLALPGAAAAVAVAADWLERARIAGAPVVHVVHKGPDGGLFDRTAPRGGIIAGLDPRNGEAVVEKPLPNAFARTDLLDRLAATGRSRLILIGFMTHMCLSSTARAALDEGYRVTIPAAACATRALPDGTGGEISAEALHRASLAALADRFAVVV